MGRRGADLEPLAADSHGSGRRRFHFFFSNRGGVVASGGRTHFYAAAGTDLTEGIKNVRIFAFDFWFFDWPKTEAEK